MKTSIYRDTFVLVCGLSLLAGGCVFKSKPAEARQFTLTPIPKPAPALAATSRPAAIEVGYVKMPSYLLRDSMVVRKSSGEIEVLDDAVWAERLDEGFRRVLEDNLSSLLASDQAHRSASGRDEASMRLSVNVEQFDVDTQGRGTLLASWRLTEAGATEPLKTDEAHLTRSGPAPRGNPQAVETTLSALIGEFSRDLASSARNEMTARAP
jgi:uncharacterized lipoprotein YmbA